MRYFTYEEHDEIVAALRHRSDLASYCPPGGANQTEAAADFWLDVLARFRRGEWADAVTEIERRFEPRDRQPWVLEAADRARRSAKKRAA